MDDLPFIPVIYMSRMVELLREEHLDTDQILNDSGISPALMSRPETMLTGRQAYTLINKYMGLSSQTYPGVSFGKRLDLAAHGLLGFVYFWEGTFEAMVTEIMAFMRVRFPLLHFELKQSDDYLSIFISCDKRIISLESFFIQTMAASMVSLGNIRTQRMVFCARQDIFNDIRSLESLLHCEVTPSQDINEIRYYETNVQFQPLRERDATSKPAPSRAEEQGLVVRLRSLLLENMKISIGAESIASNMGMSVRTLRRRLSDLGMTFNAVRTDVRMQIATRYLTTTRMSIERIADLVGYSDQATFTRAFREWKGQTPNELRQQQTQKDDVE